MTKVDVNKLQALYRKARTLQENGKHEEALECYGLIIQANPNIPEVHFQVARLFLDYIRLDEAVVHARAVTQLKPTEPDGWKLRADTVRSLSDKEITDEFRRHLKEAPIDRALSAELATAVDFGKKGKVRLNGLSEARFRSVLDQMKRGAYEVAEQNAHVLLREYPKLAVLYDMLGVIQMSSNRREEAERNLRKAISLDPHYAEARNNLAQLLANEKRFEEGLREATIALRIRPGMPPALINRAECFRGLNESLRSEADFARAVSHDPNTPDTRRRYGEALALAADYSRAAEQYEIAIRHGEKNPLTYVQLGQSYFELNRIDDAMKMYQDVFAKHPELPIISLRIGEIYQTAGQFDKALEAFTRAIDLNPRHGEVWRVAYRSQKLKLDDPIVDEMKKYFEDEEVSPISRANFGFALAKAMEDNKAYDKVFTYLRPANEIMREESAYDPAKRELHAERLIKAYDTFDWGSAEFESESDYAPIFVTGTPRSGTTLTEQIIASHSTVTGAGEVGYMGRHALKDLVGGGAIRYRSPGDISKAELEEVAEGFKDHIKTMYPESGRITDKTIAMFDYLGLVKLAMPKSKFIVVRRDPRDNLLSMYKNYFAVGTHQYTYDMKHLVAYYKHFDRMVDYWRARVPDWFYEIQYEDLVANPEEETRKLIAACGLEWEDACLDFHKTDRTVRTLSVYQVRQPMYKSSTKAWERYGDELNELFEALGPEYMDAAE